MINAIKLGTNTLELDLQITKDSQVVVSHDSYLNAMKALTSTGKNISPREQDSLYFYHLNYDSISKFDVGSLSNPLYPRRVNIPCVVPTLTNLIDCVEAFVFSSGGKPVNYNIEIKSAPEKDGLTTPDYRMFCDLSLRVLKTKKLGNRLTIQSFDTRALNYIRKHHPEVKLSYLVDDETTSLKGLLRRLDFVPDIISPMFSIVDELFVQEAHSYNMKVIPWTVDTKEETLRLKRLGVDEIITNQPDSVQTWLERDVHDFKYANAVLFFENLMGY